MEKTVLYTDSLKDYTLNTSGTIIMILSLTMVVVLSLFCIYKLLVTSKKS